MSYSGAGEGLCPFEPRTAGSSPPGPPSHPPVSSPSPMTEASLAHKVGGQIEAVYCRSDLFEGHRRLIDDRAGYLAGPSLKPQAGAALDGLPARDHCGESDPKRGGKGCPDPCPPLPSPVAHQRPKGGVALTTSTPPVRRAIAPGEGGTHEAQPHFAFP